MNNSVLYPPILETLIPAFVKQATNGVYKIRFKNSQFNSSSQKLYIDLTIKNQKSNISAIQSDYLASLEVYNEEGSDYLYINLTDSGFEVGQYYKIQIRFTTRPPAMSRNASVNDNSAEVSEWSTVGLIKFISKPAVNLLNLAVENDGYTSTVTTSEVLQIIGSVSFSGDNTEILNKYSAQLYTEREVLLADSGEIYSNPYQGLNQINYTFKYQLKDGERYKLILNIETKNGYKESYTYEITAIKSATERLNASVAVSPDVEFGRAVVSVVSTDGVPFIGNITIRRSSNKDNFTVWEDVHTVSLIEDTPINYTWYDHTVESGVLYKYCAQRRDANGNRGVVVYAPSPVLVEFNDMFLSAEGEHLRIKYNHDVSSYRRNILESKTDTIGSKYPFIKRNGHVDYKVFEISGLINYYSDVDSAYGEINHSAGIYKSEESTLERSLFTTREKLYNGSDALFEYNKYNNDNNIPLEYDYILEKYYREAVSDFLYKDNVKLFRTLTEGSALVKLTEITLTPFEVSGRYLYTFSATATEIDDLTVENMDKYGVQVIGTYSKDLKKEREVLGQINDVIPKNVDVITEVLQDKYQRRMPSGRIADITRLTHLKIEFNDTPYAIVDNGTSFEPVEGVVSEADAAKTLIGYCVNINSTPIFVNRRGVYELSGEQLEIKNISFPKDSNVTIDYIAILTDKENEERTVVSYQYRNVVGQEIGLFNPNESIFNIIWDKYYEDYNKYLQRLITINAINIEADPGSIVWVRENVDSTVHKHILNPTGRLLLQDDNSIIQEFYFGGVHLYEATAADLLRDILPFNKYYLSGVTVNNINAIPQPKKNYVYTIAGEQKIYYKDKFYLFDNGDVLCPVEGLVDYYCEVSKGEYA